MASGEQVYESLNQISGMSAMSFSVIKFVTKDENTFKAYCEYLRVSVAEKGCPPEEIESDYQDDSIREMLSITMDELAHITSRAEIHRNRLRGDATIIFTWRG